MREGAGGAQPHGCEAHWPKPKGEQDILVYSGVMSDLPLNTHLGAHKLPAVLAVLSEVPIATGVILCGLHSLKEAPKGPLISCSPFHQSHLQNTVLLLLLSGY